MLVARALHHVFSGDNIHMSHSSFPLSNSDFRPKANFWFGYINYTQ